MYLIIFKYKNLLSYYNYAYQARRIVNIRAKVKKTIKFKK